jgi:hypothetical protein
MIALPLVLQYRMEGGRPAAPVADALHLAAEAAAQASPRSAAAVGAVVTQNEAEAALGEEEDDRNE